MRILSSSTTTEKSYRRRVARDGPSHQWQQHNPFIMRSTYSLTHTRTYTQQASSGGEDREETNYEKGNHCRGILS